MQMTTLGYALLGLVQEEPRSGYALRKVFETTPMGTFSSSPGSIYPALKKLAKAGMIEQRSPVPGGKDLFHITPLGVRNIRAWLTAPVTKSEVASSVDLALLKFAFLPSIDDAQVTLTFLNGFKSAIAEQIADLKAYLSSPEGKTVSQHGRLAVENGLMGYEAHLNWAIRAIGECQS